ALQEFQHFVEATALVESEQNNLITSKTPGLVINSILVKPGDRVSAGQLLCTVDNSALAQNLEAVKIQLSLAQTAYDRQKNLWDKKIGSEIQFLQAKAQKEASERQKANLEMSIANTNIYAPFAGTIDAVNFKLGDNTAAFNPAQNFGGIRIVNNSRLKLTAKLADSYINKVHVGDRVKFVIPDNNNKEVEATVSYVSSTILSDKRTFDVVVWLTQNTDLKPNMNATMKINDVTLKKVFVVSENIVHSSEGQKSILILAHEAGKSIVRKVVITTGENYGGLVVVNGLKEGDEIITSGYAGINDGEEVKHFPL
ncbi:MAG: efflux RND transporter periplasmic adaptor subunit, partial [Bacteroidetes bacterium]|nr:efflux RND transporter periplasmic adaptor subunit [Bacteroidota bacterium]